MADLFQITPPTIRAEGKDVPPEQIQAGFNSLARQTQNALNTVGSDPTGPAGGDLSGNYPNPTVSAVHATSGTMSGVAVTSSTVDSTPVGGTTPAAGTFTTAVAGSVFANGGAVPGVATTGTQVYNSPNPTVQFIDSVRSSGNKNAFITWGSTVLALGVANDAFTGFTNALAITGGQVSGISGITSTSGTGSWAHTGGFSATGGVNSTAVGNVTPSTGAFTTLSANSTVSGAGFTSLFASPSPIGSTAANTGAFTTLTASTAIGVASGGTGRATLTAHGVLIGEGTAAVNQTAVGVTGQMLLGVTGADPAFGNNPTITGGTIDGATVGATTASSGKFTTITASSTITPSSTSGIVGTTTNDNANAGSIGEYVTNTATTVAISNSTATNVTSISLTAGDWDVEGQLQSNPAGTTTQSDVAAGISTTSATFATLAPGFNNQFAIPVSIGAGLQANIIAPRTRISLASTTTVFLIGFVSYAVSTLTVSGFIRARRVR